ncbi:MAG TPA: lipid A deacylase LpxR family protein [Verrucomicrobiae bacterium]
MKQRRAAFAKAIFPSWKTFAALVMVALCWLNPPAKADPQKGILTVTEEDDSFSNPFRGHQDRHYTQGLKISLFSGDGFMTNAATWFNGILYESDLFSPANYNFGLILMGQNIYTPEDLLASAPIPTDRPYAGWLYTGAAFQRRSDLAANFSVAENFEINLGMVGPASLAAQAQTAVHRWWFPDDIPQGWDNQLKNEPGLLLKYGRSWRWSPTADSARYFDVIPHLGAELGNVATLATGGLSMRAGLNLPANFGEQINDSPTSPSSPFTTTSPWFSAYIFGGVDGRAVAHDITLDGNSFRDGPSVDKYPFVADLSWGFALQISSYLELAYVHVERTKQFRGQQGNDLFGSINLKFNLQF